MESGIQNSRNGWDFSARSRFASPRKSVSIAAPCRKPRSRPSSTIATNCSARKKSAITTARPTDCRWKIAGRSRRIAATVDASLATVKLAIAARADLLIVHHGLFWSPAHPWTGKKYELLRLLVENNLAVYSSHLPLDAHPKLGNNAQLCAALGLKNLKPFFLTHGQTIGFKIADRRFPARNWRNDWSARPARSRKSFPAARIFANASAS